MTMMFAEQEWECAHKECEAKTWEAHKGLDHPFDPIRPCKACGDMTTGSWCSNSCFYAEDGYPDDDDSEDYNDDDDRTD